MSPDCDCDAVVDPGTQQTLAISLNHLISGVLSKQLQQQLQQKQYNKANQKAGLAFYGKLSRLCGRRRKIRRRGGAYAACDLADCGKQLANKAKDNSSSSSNSSDSKRKQKQAGRERERECERETLVATCDTAAATTTVLVYVCVARKKVQHIFLISFHFGYS